MHEFISIYIYAYLKILSYTCQCMCECVWGRTLYARMEREDEDRWRERYEDGQCVKNSDKEREREREMKSMGEIERLIKTKEEGERLI